MNTFLSALVERLPKRLQPVAKMLVPLTLGIATAVTDLSISGEELRVLAELAGTAVTSLLVYSIPNR